MGGIGVRMNEHDRDGFDPETAQPPRRLAAGLFIERLRGSAIDENAFRHFQNEARRHRPLGLLPNEEVFLARNFVPPDLQHVAKAGRDQHAGFRALAFEHRIGCDRAAMKDSDHFACRDLRNRQDFFDPVEEAA